MSKKLYTLEEIEAERNRRKQDEFFVDRDCVMFDGHCDCPRKLGENYPECKKYGDKKNVQ